ALPWLRCSSAGLQGGRTTSASSWNSGGWYLKGTHSNAQVNRIFELSEKKSIKNVSKLASVIEIKDDETNALKKRIENLEKQLKEYHEREGVLESKVIKLEAKIKSKVDHGYDMFILDFDRAVSQVKLIMPKADLSPMNVTKVVVNGVMVDDDVQSMLRSML
ncbi:hypothetical protein PIB30_091118, partial [Stylosanthes scabra]|nr:hypothetical protein [Stylosanthes scabra]